MGLDSVIRNGIALADSITKSLQVTISHYPWIGNNDAGEPVHDETPVSLKALTEKKRKLIRMPDSKEMIQVTMITIIGPVTANGAPNREEPIDPRDRLVLPDGTTGPIVDVNGLLDPVTGKPYMYEVALG